MCSRLLAAAVLVGLRIPAKPLEGPMSHNAAPNHSTTHLRRPQNAAAVLPVAAIAATRERLTRP